MKDPTYKLFSHEDYDRWEGMLKAIAKKQETLSTKVHIDDRLSESTHNAVMELLAAVKKRIGEPEQ